MYYQLNKRFNQPNDYFSIRYYSPIKKLFKEEEKRRKVRKRYIGKCIIN